MRVSNPSADAIERLRERDLLELVEGIAKAHHVSAADVCGRGRTAAAAAARHAVWRKLRETTSLSLPEIGRLFDRDPSSVHAVVGLPGKNAGKYRAAEARAALRVI